MHCIMEKLRLELQKEFDTVTGFLGNRLLGHKVISIFQVVFLEDYQSLAIFIYWPTF